MTIQIIEGIRILLICILVTQLTYGFTIFLLEGTMTRFYASGVYENPKSLYQKSVNFYMLGLMGSGYHIYLRLKKYNWFIRKILFFFALIIQSIASIIVYKIIYGSLKAIFL